jgi:hypothetical protein
MLLAVDKMLTSMEEAASQSKEKLKSVMSRLTDSSSLDSASNDSPPNDSQRMCVRILHIP